MKVGFSRFDWSIGPPEFSKPRDTITWERDQTCSPARILDTIRPSGEVISLTLLMKYELGIASKMKNSIV